MAPSRSKSQPKNPSKSPSPGPSKGRSKDRSKRDAPAKRSRYTPPAPKKDAPSPLWVPVVMSTLLLTGLVVIIANYMELLPGDGVNRYLLLGLGQITAGFMLATTYR